MSAPSHMLVEIAVGDTAEAWRSAGFSVVDNLVRVGSVRIQLLGTEGARGVQSLAIEGVGEAIDGVAVHSAAPDEVPPPVHANGVVDVDHVVMLTPDCDRTTAALERTGIESRRVRRFEIDGAMRRQTFFWLGDVILELVGPDQSAGKGPASVWGLALISADLDGTAASLGSAAGRPKIAIQPGRRILTVRTDELDITTTLAVMSEHQSVPHPPSDAPSTA